MQDKAKAMVIASFAGDSLALGAHWIYDTQMIEAEFGRIEGLLDAVPNSYHATKRRGAFTHYGDQTMVLLESLAARKRFDLSDFSERWRALFREYNGYLDKATKATMMNFDSGAGPATSGSSSTDLAGAGRIAPLVYALRSDPEGLVESARAQTRMTHNNPLVIDSAEFFARVVRKVLDGGSPVSVIREVAGEPFKDAPIAEWVSDGLGSVNRESAPAIGRFGQSCHTAQAFPSVIHLIAKYESNLKDALIENVMAGGDSAARGMIEGMVLGAWLGAEGIPEEWISGLVEGAKIESLLDEV
ncbi:MAG: ADP-ribosylglycohydrolase family protein [Deltaproteobacteria bacterium]|nr:ADP-ribosylglycohydrolase family protein [Deltaproteobacteria bacterium]